MSYIVRPYRKGKPLSTIILLESQHTKEEAERICWQLNKDPGITATLEMPGEKPPGDAHSGARSPSEGREGSLEGPRTRETSEERL